MARRRMRMAELVRHSGVPRETIHFYLREGLLPPPEKAGRTLAYYDDAHLERLRLVRHLRDEKYLPIPVIRSILNAGLEGSRSRDADTLADVLSIDPALGKADAAAPDDETVRVALELGLLGPGVLGAEPKDPTQARVLSAVAEALSLEGDARELTLEDLRVCARELTRLVDAEAAAFFDVVLRRGNLPAGVRALRAGRSAVARFLMAYRDWMLRRIVEGLLGAIERAPEDIQRTRSLPLSPEALALLGEPEHVAGLSERARRGDAAAANDLVWHLFAVGPARELGRLPARVKKELRPRAELLVAYATLGNGSPDALRAAAERTGGFPLGEILVAEVELGAALSGEGGVLESAVPALCRLGSATPELDADPLASALGLLRRGQITAALPPALGRQDRAVADLERALAVLGGAPGRVPAAARACIEGNARLALARIHVGRGQPGAARAHLERARAIDPSGPLASAADAALSPLVAEPAG